MFYSMGFDSTAFGMPIVATLPNDVRMTWYRSSVYFLSKIEITIQDEYACTNQSLKRFTSNQSRSEIKEKVNFT